MPAFYAHYRFGKQILPALPDDVRQSIHRFRRLYDMGLQGPDFFFYHNPFFRTAARDLGDKFHSQTGQEFFTRVCAQADSEAAKVYLYGLLGHYCLDSACHPFVERMVEEGQAAHSPLEAEFERYLMDLDGKQPDYPQSFAKHIRLTGGECATVSSFYPPATPFIVYQAVGFMTLYTRFLNQKNRPRVEQLLNLVKKSLRDHLIPEVPDARFTRMNSELLARFNRAVKDYPSLLQQLTAHLCSGDPLGEDFAPSFEH